MLYRCVLIASLLFFIASVAAFAEALKKDDSPSDQENIRIEIHHCTTCGFQARASSLAEELEKEFGVEAKLVVGKAGSFDVFVNGELIFSKSKEGRFPEPGEIAQKIRENMQK